MYELQNMKRRWRHGKKKNRSGRIFWRLFPQNRGKSWRKSKNVRRISHLHRSCGRIYKGMWIVCRHWNIWRCLKEMKIQKSIPLCLDKEPGIRHFFHYQIMPESNILKQEHIFSIHLGNA